MVHVNDGDKRGERDSANNTATFTLPEIPYAGLAMNEYVDEPDNLNRETTSLLFVDGGAAALCDGRWYTIDGIVLDAWRYSSSESSPPSRARRRSAILFTPSTAGANAAICSLNDLARMYSLLSCCMASVRRASAANEASSARASEARRVAFTFHDGSDSPMEKPLKWVFSSNSCI